MKRLIYINFLILGVLLFSTSCNNNNVEKKETTSDTTKLDSLSISALTLRIRKEPTNASLFNKRADLYFQELKIDSAISDIKIALRLDSTVTDYYVKYAEFSMRIGQSLEAKNTLERCIRNIPNNTDAMLKLAELHLYVQQYKQSIEFLKKVQEINSSIPNIYFIRSMVLLETGDTANAVDQLQITIEKEPRFYNAYILLGNLYSIKPDSIAISYYNNAIKLVPNSIEAHYNLGMYYQNNKRLDDAIKIYQRMIDTIAPAYPNSYYNIGYIHLEYKKDYKKALELFQKAFKADPQYIEALYNSGVCFEKMKEYAKARNIYNECLKMKTNYELAINGLNRLDKIQK